tara:strand:+ start:487 stop:972 length:486 start_codon:yes stop_codon:yes gene_type:complete
MDVFLVLIALFFCFFGLIGSFVPIIPGPITSWLGILILDLTSFVNIRSDFLVITFAIAMFITILDFTIPLFGIKKLGGSKGGLVGGSIGLIIGIFLIGPFGILIGPFIGALAGELLNNKNIRDSLYPALGSLIGVLAGLIIKFFFSMIILVYFLYELIDNF